MDVTAGGLAAKAQLKMGDESTAVDSVAASSISLSAMRQRLCDEMPGTIAKLMVEHDHYARSVALTLADQI